MKPAGQPELAERAAGRLHRNVLPQNLPPRGLSRLEAAAYVGISPTLFDQLVAEGLMPRPISMGRRRIWDVRALDRAMDALAAKSHSDDGDDKWDVAL